MSGLNQELNPILTAYRALDIKLAEQLVAYEKAQNPSADCALLEQSVLELSAALGRGQSCIPAPKGMEAFKVVCCEPAHYANQPLVLERGKLYLARYYFYETSLLQQIQQRLSQPQTVDTQLLQDALARLFPASVQEKTQAINWQKIAAASACLQKFSIITGGPGTGKTTTVIKLLSALLSLDASTNIALAAPTGKAAARMTESIRGSKIEQNKLLLHAELIPEQSFTLHRLLGWSPRGYRYHAGQHLPYDCVVVDEASMIDLPMMSHLMQALSPSARLILLGDKDQLASVEVGSVLADLCNAGAELGPDADFARLLETITGFDLNAAVKPKITQLQNAVAQLKVSYRFDDQSGIGQLARAVNAGLSTEASKCFADLIFAQELRWLTPPQQTLRLGEWPAWRELIQQGYAPFVQAVQDFVSAEDANRAQAKNANSVFQALNQFQILAVQRKGHLGVENLNRLIAQQLKPKLPRLSEQAGLNLLAASSQWYYGRVVMISENNYDLKLSNGDLGICLPHQGKLRVAFASSVQDENGQPSTRWLLPSRLPTHETAFAITVHKSQGSEFTHAALVLPQEHSPIITKELIYTAITRAKERFSLLSNQGCWEQGLKERVQRASGLREVLWGE